MRSKSWRVLLSGVVAVPLAVACGSDAEHTAVTPSIQTLAASACDFAYRCCAAGEVAYFVGPIVTADNCAARLLEASDVSYGANFTLGAFPALSVLLPNAAALDRAVNDHRTTIDPTAMKACTDYLATTACNKQPVAAADTTTIACQPLDPPADDNPCDPSKLFIGKLNEGDTCTSGGTSFECKPGFLCSPNSGLGVEGECVRAGQEGDLCFPSPPSGFISSLDTGQGCDNALYCSALDGKCHKPAGPGEPCAFGDKNKPPDPSTQLVQCRSDLSCDWISSTCVVRCQDGASCGSDADCDATKQLQCLGVDDTSVITGVGTDSNTAAVGAGRCGLPRAKGLPCAIDRDCADSLGCSPDPTDATHQICQDKAANGAPCTSVVGEFGTPTHSQCQSGFCDPTLGQCAPQVAPPGLCPSGESDQCAGGTCIVQFTGCTVDTDCPGTAGKCNTAEGECSPYCVALKAEGAICTLDTDCVSSACIGGFCRTPPLGIGADCTADTQCSSKFCGLETKRVCTSLPLDSGSACVSGDQCSTLVCYGAPAGIGTGGAGGLFGAGGSIFNDGVGGVFNDGLGGAGGSFNFPGLGTASTCTSGLGVGDLCGADLGKPPCDPKQLFCDDTQNPPRCAPFHATGESCERDEECRGQCVIRAGWKMCDATPAPGAAVCDK